MQRVVLSGLERALLLTRVWESDEFADIQRASPLPAVDLYKLDARAERLWVGDGCTITAVTGMLDAEHAFVRLEAASECRGGVRSSAFAYGANDPLSMIGWTIDWLRELDYQDSQ